MPKQLIEAKVMSEAQNLSKPGAPSLLAIYVTNAASTLDRIRREATCQPSTQTITVTSRPPDI